MEITNHLFEVRESPKLKKDLSSKLEGIGRGKEKTEMKRPPKMIEWKRQTIPVISTKIHSL